MSDGTLVPPEEDEFDARQWGLTEEQTELPYAKEAAMLESDDILMDVTETNE